MAYESLQAVIGTAVIDSNFRKNLLNGSRYRAIASFDLTLEERDAVMGIRADSLEQFAGQLDRWIANALGRSEPPALALPSHNRRMSAH
jgi:hypothetical protein